MEERTANWFVALSKFAYNFKLSINREIYDVHFICKWNVERFHYNKSKLANSYINSIKSVLIITHRSTASHSIINSQTQFNSDLRLPESVLHPPPSPTFRPGPAVILHPSRCRSSVASEAPSNGALETSDLVDDLLLQR